VPPASAPSRQTAVPAEVAPDANSGIGLCLSGGGFRATLFHLGVARRLNELGILSRLKAISSVSGGSILNGVLATRWPLLRANGCGVFTNFDEQIVQPVRSFCGEDLRTPLLLLTRLNPANWGELMRDYFSVSANRLAVAYEPLFHGRALSAVQAPGPNVPRFVFCATNLRTGACWQLHGGPDGRMGDFYTGYCSTGHVQVSEAVAASSAFTPGFSALRLRMQSPCVMTRVDPWSVTRVASVRRGAGTDGGSRAVPLLTDGGVYDNLGLEPMLGRFRFLLASDAGRPFDSVSASSQFILARLRRALEIGLEQAAALRRRWLVDEFIHRRQLGALWTIQTSHSDFPIPDSQGYGPHACSLLRRIRTDLNRFTEGEMACLENHGYSLADTALRSRVPALCPDPVPLFAWPHADWLGEADIRDALGKSHLRRFLWDVLSLLRPRRRSGRSESSASPNASTRADSPQTQAASSAHSPGA
jgi:NTE family protein